MSRVLVSPRCFGVLAILGACMLVPLVPVAVVVMSLPARATEPPPPVQFTVTVSTEEGGDCTLVRVREWYGTYIGEWTNWSTGPIQQTYDAGVNVEIDATVNCPCAYEFKEWVDEHGSVLDYRRDERHEFTLTHDTVAKAVFKERTGSLTIYVEDPSSDASPHSWLGDTGHTMWKFEGGCTGYDDFVGIRWGFWPEDATPYQYSGSYKLWVDCGGVVQNDNDYDYNRTPKTYSISYAALVAGLQYTAALKLNPMEYRVEVFNCTDAAIFAANAAGVTLPSAAGSCNHLTHSFTGNCPGVLGENIQQ
ncbi:MAG: hypothetical protein AMXMBFR82_03850 [Candidatus Hydrogenedentota bacterium]